VANGDDRVRRLFDAAQRLRDSEDLLVICLATVLVMAGQGIITPNLALYARSFGVSAALIGVAVSAFGLGRLVLNVPLGVVADRYGRRLVLIGGPIVISVSMFGSAVAPNIGVFLFWRFVAGMGSAMYMTGAQIYLADISTPSNRAKNIATNQGALFIGVSVGPVIGGFVAEWFGLRAPFLVVGLFVLLASLHAWLRLPETRPAPRPFPPAANGDERARERPVRQLLSSRNFLAVSAVSFALFVTRTGGQQALLPLHGANEFGLSSGGLGLVFTMMALVNLVALAPSALLADRFGRKWAIVPSGVAAAIGLLLVGASGTALAFVLAAFVYAAGLSVSGPAPAAYAADIAPAHLRGVTLGLFRSIGDLGIVVGPTAMGAIAAATSIPVGMAATAAVLAVACVSFGLFATETVRRTHTAGEEVMVATAASEPELA
jgi:DHA1 family multidrug resistance protein-like MFS transporter